ncbi:MAG: alpha/beta hydrolase [Luteibacter sp.]|uniref:alpha/beta hydrolase n=1 Tax=Luteibacter sp. TaxID=1886636 RepID=UPI0028076174|nr:alpha/beta hydrolase [Luteibacter sp.]MDQ7997525.1 alpha/beta hydrolase [Luteibacter sp.]MDQ8050011.1 alpha/beta hydrolase [Luteibacter sp.]
MTRLFLVSLGALLLSGCQSALFGVINARQSSTGVVAHHDIVYDPSDGLALDVYGPVDAKNAPVVVFLYGGSWKSGKRQWYRWVGEALASRGIVTVVPDYRLWPKVKLDGFVGDAAKAVRWTHDRVGTYGGDTGRVFVMGHSAGGHIAALLATDARWLGAVGMKPRDLSGVIGLAGPYDFLPLKDDDFIDMFGHTPAEQARSQPVNFVDGDEPPALLLQGQDDSTVRPSNALSLQRRYEAQGESVVVKLYPDMGHMGILFALRGGKKAPPVLDDVVHFVGSRSPATPVAANVRTPRDAK